MGDEAFDVGDVWWRRLIGAVLVHMRVVEWDMREGIGVIEVALGIRAMELTFKVHRATDILAKEMSKGSRTARHNATIKKVTTYIQESQDSDRTVSARRPNVSHARSQE